MSSQRLPFYLTLPSDSSMGLYPGNNAADFMTRLPAPIVLQGGWEVALVEYFYPNTMYNIPTGHSINVRQHVSFANAIPPCESVIRVPAGIYTASDLIECIESQSPVRAQWGEAQLRVADHSPKAFKFHQIKSERKSRISFFHLLTEINFPEHSQHLRKMLGFTQSTICSTDSAVFNAKLEKGLFKTKSAPEEVRSVMQDQMSKLQFLFDKSSRSPEPAAIFKEYSEIVSARCINMSFGNQSLYIYTDLVNYCTVGDSVAQLLRSIPIKTKSAFEIVTERFDRPHYVPVMKSYIETIQMTTCSDLGNDAKFESGKTQIKLHFRPAQFT